MLIQRATANELYQELLGHFVLPSSLTKVAPRGQPTYELPVGTTLKLTHPEFNVITSKERKLNYAFMAAEFLWMFLGQNDKKSIGYYNPHLHYFSDNGITFNGAYGPKIVEQLGWCVQKLREDPNTRQAVLTIWRERPGISKDVPCTCLFQFFNRDGRLHLVTYMRSNDVWLGFPYDLFNFTTLQNYVASALGLELGNYTHHVGSLHLYEKNLGSALQANNELIVQNQSRICEIKSPSLLTPMPVGVPAWFNALHLPTSNIACGNPHLGLFNLSQDVPTNSGWYDLLNVMAFHTHKDTRFLSPFWRTIYGDARDETFFD